MNIAIFGASGYIGLRLANRFKRESSIKKLKLFNRNKRKILHLMNEKVSAFDYEINLKNKEQIKKDLKDIDIVYYLIHSMYEKNNFSEVDNQLATIVAEASTEANVKKIIYLGGLGLEEEGLSNHLSSRQETADFLREHHKNVIEFRAGIIIGGGSSSFEIVRSLGTKLPFIPLLWKNEGLVEPIFVDNVINYLLLAKKDSNMDNKILEIGCGESIKYTEIIDIYAKIKERRLLKIKLGMLEPIFSDKVLGRVISFMSSLPPALVTPLLGGVTNKAISSKYKVDDVLGYCSVKPVSIEKALRYAAKREEGEHILSIWDLPSSMSKVKKLVHKQNGHPFSTASKEIEGLLFEEESIILEDYIKGSKKEEDIKIFQEKIFQEVKQIGGNHGYWSPSILWKSRALIDKILGGVGFRKYRRDCTDLRCGDRIDFWTVEKVTSSEYYKELRLKAEMKLPGEAWLRFTICKDKETGNSKFKLQAIFDPNGIFGYAYWYSLFFIHKYIFKTMIKNIFKNVEENKKSSSC